MDHFNASYYHSLDSRLTRKRFFNEVIIVAIHTVLNKGVFPNEKTTKQYAYYSGYSHEEMILYVMYLILEARKERINFESTHLPKERESLEKLFRRLLCI